MTIRLVGPQKTTIGERKSSGEGRGSVCNGSVPGKVGPKNTIPLRRTEDGKLGWGDGSRVEKRDTSVTVV